MSKFADLYVDDAYRLSPVEALAWQPSEWCEFKVEDLISNLKAVQYALTIPRRLGDVSAAELGRDKRRLRKLSHTLQTLIGLWGAMCPEVELNLNGNISPERRKAGAQLQMERYLAEQIDKATLHRSMFATRALQTGNRTAANRGCRYYTRELADYERILALPLAG